MKLITNFKGLLLPTSFFSQSNGDLPSSLRKQGSRTRCHWRNWISAFAGMTYCTKEIKFILVICSFALVSGCFTNANEDEHIEVDEKIIQRAEIIESESVELTPQELERLKSNGEYLVNIAACGSCHSSDGTIDAPLSGGRTLYDEYGAIVVPNITPDKKTGIGNWSVGQIKRAIRVNISSDGRLLSPVSHSTYRWLSDEDSNGIALYLQSIPPRENKIEPRVLTKFKLKKWGILSQHLEIAGYVPKMAENAGAYRGLYLTSFVQNCSRCHSPSQRMTDKTDFLSGHSGNLFFNDSKDIETVVPSIRNSEPALKNWSEEQIVGYFDKPKNKSSICPVEYYSKMTLVDKKAVASFLKSLEN